jgi:predicted amidohydrolase YtcJ
VGVHSIERKQGLELLEEFNRRKQLGLRLYVSADGFMADEWAAWQGEVRPQGMKWYADGALGSHTAWLLSPDQHGTTGVPVMQGAALRTVVEEALELGLNPETHAIGDRAVREVLDIYEPLLPNHPSQFFRIEHVQHIDKSDLGRLRHANLLLSVQPCHLLSDQEALASVPHNPNRLDYAYRSMLTHGATLILGTDFPIEPADPWRNMRVAMDRCDRGDESIDPHECLSWPQVLSAYTRLPAQSAGWHETGQLMPGRKADLVIVRHDPLSAPAWEQQVELTMHDGRIMHSSGGIDFPCDWPTQ